MKIKIKKKYLAKIQPNSIKVNHYPNASTKEFLKLVKFQLRLQGREPQFGTGGHPDPVIRKFYRAITKVISKKTFSGYRNLVVQTHINRPALNDTHFVNLWFRALQCVLRRRKFSKYISFTDVDWQNYLATAGHSDLPAIQEILLTHNTATHLPARYRSFNTALRLITSKYPDIDIRIGDIGCSLGLGIKACLANGFLSKPSFVDNTPNHQVINCFHQTITRCSRAIGIDIRIPNIDWVKACNYPSRYSRDGAALSRAITKLSHIPFKVAIKQADILMPSAVKVLTDNRPLTAIYSSMAMYELSPKNQQVARRNIAAALCHQGFFIEFTFIDPDNWFKGIHTVVRVNRHGRLSAPLVWHIWKDSRCSQVYPGKDFDKVNNLLTSFGSKL